MVNAQVRGDLLQAGAIVGDDAWNPRKNGAQTAYG